MQVFEDSAGQSALHLAVRAVPTDEVAATVAWMFKNIPDSDLAHDTHRHTYTHPLFLSFAVLYAQKS